MTVLLAHALTVAALVTGRPYLPLTRVQRHRRYQRRVVGPYRLYFNSVASCESAGRWHLDTGNGFFGGLQFTLSSWRAVGGVGYPHLASRLEQRYRAVRLLRLQGPGAWPVCGA